MSKNWNRVLLGRGGEMSLIYVNFENEKVKIIIEYDEQHVLRVGIKCFWAYQFKMSLMPANLFQTTRLKFFMKTMHTICSKLESSGFRLSKPK